MSDSLKVFVYGTLKPGEANYQRYCALKVVEEKRAIAHGLLFALPAGYPAMTAGDRSVHGFLLTFSDLAVLLDLDELEDFCPNREATENEYQRRLIRVYEPNRKYLGKAWAYLMIPEQVHQKKGVLLPSGWWTLR